MSKCRIWVTMAWEEWSRCFAVKPTTAVHRISVSTLLTQLWKILHDDCFYPCHLQRVQKLPPGDISCILFCKWPKPWLQILPSILFMMRLKLHMMLLTQAILLKQWNSHHRAKNNFQQQFVVSIWSGLLLLLLPPPPPPPIWTYFIVGH
jgi:hypothetical protein